MSKQIRVLQPQLANQIAAGEVVERPASVVKELVENSVDAGSTAITVEITGGGIDFIRVTDNGSGMEPEDVPTAFLRHATSKISKPDDLTHIETLGFRGEALSSIAAVAEVVIQTRMSDALEGTYFEIRGGETVAKRPCGCPEGTTVTVARLFYNTPARLKFLKTTRSEAGYVSDYMARMIMAHPEISFLYRNQDKTVYHSPGDGDVRTAIFSVYGKDVLHQIKPVAFDDGYLAIHGYIGDETLTRPNRQQQSLFINGRYIRSLKVSYALERAYHQRLMAGKYPFAVLSIQISSNEIDVNVHPNKLEIRFKNEERVVNSVTRAARAALGDYVVPSVSLPVWHGADKTPDLNRTPIKPYSAGQAERNVPQKICRPNDRQEKPPVLSPRGTVGETPITSQLILRETTLEYDIPSQPAETMVAEENMPCESPIPRGNTAPTSQASEQIPLISIAVDVPAEQEAGFAEAQQAQPAFGTKPFQIAGKLFETYWIIQQESDAFLIDQHAAHERILYQKLSSKVKVGSQQLMTPAIIRLSAIEFRVWEENQEQFIALGYDMGPFGENTVCVRAVPYLLGEPQGDGFLRDAIDALLRQKQATPLALKQEAIIQASCKHAVKGGNILSEAEIRVLLDAFAHDGIPLTCPHGRPVMVRLSKRELEKMFKRIV